MQRALSEGALGLTTCSDKWPEFTTQPLESCQRITHPTQPESFKGFTHGSNYQGLFVEPSLKFGFCTIEKNGCSEWTAVLNKMLLNDTSVNGAAYDVVAKSEQKFGSEGKTSVFSDPLATRVVMVRDPLARFASAFLEKCTRNNCDSGGYCLPRPWASIPEGTPIPFKLAVDFMLSQGTPESPAQLDGHWRIQSEHCELSKRVGEYTVVGMMKKDTFAQDSTCIMDLAKLQRYNDRGQSEGNAPFWGTADEMASKGNALNGNKDTKTDVNEEEVLKRLFTKEAATKLIEHFKQDYDTFNLPLPGWVDEATGELYENVPDDFCEPSVELEASGSAYDEWDVVTLFSNAGYS